MGVRTDNGRSSAMDGLHLPRATTQDDLVMNTNNSSIVSKRSVERLYYPDEAHFFRFFVKKFQRRAPLINRGYHLRLHVIDVTLRDFLRRPSEKRKVIVNLGCGSDVVPWQCWTRYPEHCRSSQAVFFDVDFNELARRKRQVILETPELASQLSEAQAGEDALYPNLLLRSKCYHLVGCDLRRTAELQQALNSVLDPNECIFLFLAEVSITYMETNSADALILPDGSGHPFARTMMDHFNKLSTPIKSVAAYPDVPTQCARFAGRGWSNIRAQSLWSAWNDDRFLSADDRRKLDDVEPFDEWEEFCLFASHYLILHAANYVNERVRPCSADCSPEIPSIEATTTYKPLTGHHGLRRFGTAMIASDTLGRTSILNYMGLGPTTRLSSYDIYKLHGSGVDIRAKPTGPSSRGKSGATAISDAVMLFDPDKGWVTCEVNGSPTPRPVFGAILTCSGREQEGMPTFHGFLIGGISDGVIQSQILAWDLVLSNREAPSITFKPVETDEASSTLLSRFGATCIQQEDRLVVLGGVGHDGVIPQTQEVLLCSMVGSKIQVTGGIPLSDTGEGQEISRPLIVGSSVVSPQNGQIVILGGGATCFSMGSFWTRGSYTLSIESLNRGTSSRPLPPRTGWEFSGIGEIDPRPSSAPDHGLDSQPAEIRPIPHVNVSSKESFEHIVRQGSPVLIEGLDIGTCRSKWTLDYLAEQLGDRQVVVHECNVRNMDFNAKNFRYTSMAFGDFAREVRNGARVYLRALSADAPANQPANLAHDFPSLAADFRLPEALNMCLENMHSSVLRVSGQVDMWLHYDVQANVYCQVSGSKRMLLFPPSDVVKMSFAPGSSSSSTDVFSRLGSPALGGTHPWEAVLKAGDVLFLPPLWLHTATPTSNASVAVNVFFRSLGLGYSAGRDVYGNRDLAAYEKGRQEIARISKAFAGAPVEARHFYMLRLAGELAEAARADQ
ncbi:hypothetical protein LA080_003500 [Diaporthe eres]|nr:hypothetical protein LA080_003500 [Diaporthe eres]